MLTHNIQGAADIGIPMRLLVDVVSEKNSDFYKRLIHFCVNSKQVSVSSMLVRCELNDLVNTVSSVETAVHEALQEYSAAARLVLKVLIK